MVNDIKKTVDRYSFDGEIIDVGCGQKPFIDLFPDCQKYVGIDFPDYSINKDFGENKPDVYFTEDYVSSMTLPFKDKSFNHCVSFQVIEHHPEPNKFIRELSRVTKDDGYIMITCPFLFGIHEEPNDYQRYTKYALMRLFKRNKCKILEIIPEGSVFSVISTLLNLSLNYWASKSSLLYLLCSIVYPPFLIIQYLSLGLDKVVKSEISVLNYLVIAQKKKAT